MTRTDTVPSGTSCGEGRGIGEPGRREARRQADEGRRLLYGRPGRLDAHRAAA